MTVAELLSDPARWTQGKCARDKDGNVARVLDESAYSFCLIGALYRCYQEEESREAASLKLEKAIGTTFTRAVFNDTHTHAEVLAAVRKAGI